MTRYHAHPNGYLTIDDDPTPVLATTPSAVEPDGFSVHALILSELASDGNHAREWAAQAYEIMVARTAILTGSMESLLHEMAEYHRGKTS